MFAGKTDELHRRLRRATHGHKPVILFTADNRYGGESKTHHSTEAGVSTYPVANLLCVETTDPHKLLDGDNIIGIDEIQFIDADVLLSICRRLATNNTVIVAGLDNDFKGKPFEATVRLMAEADKVKKLSAVCVDCGKDATKSFRTSGSEERILEGGADTYIALCRQCFVKRK